MRRVPSIAKSLAVVVIATAVTAPGVRAQGIAIGDGKLDIHGYLTQGYGITSGPQFYGMQSRGTSDLRYAALQFRYDRKQDGFLIQINHRRLGNSPVTDFESALNVNWAFYEHRFRNASTVKVGRIPIPRGIYNERRSIGVILPFYRAPAVFYDEGAYYSETIDGAVGTMVLNRGSAWPLTVHGYAGGWSELSYDQSGTQYAVAKVRAENGVGTQLWLGTPIDGLRVGAAYQHYELNGWTDSTGLVSNRQNVSEWQGSVDGTFDRFFLRGESEGQLYEHDHFFSNYIQAGVKLPHKLGLNAQREWSTEREWQTPEYPRNFDWHKAFGTSITYSFSPSLVLKVEEHWNKGIQVEQHADPRDPPKFRYGIASLSASF